MDFLTLEKSKGGYQHILVITDHYTRYAQAIPTKNQLAKTTAEAFFNHFIVHYGIPKRIHSDQGTNFESKVIKELLSTYRYEEIKNHQLSSYGEWHVRKVQQNTIEYALVVGITPKTELESLLRSNDPFIQQYKA